jgi:DNA transformation protein
MSDARRRIASLKNLGAKSAERIVAVGITDAEILETLGSVAAFHRVKTAFPNDTSLNLLWALQGALMEIHWHDVPPELKHQLLQELERITRE